MGKVHWTGITGQGKLFWKQKWKGKRKTKFPCPGFLGGKLEVWEFANLAVIVVICSANEERIKHNPRTSKV